MYNFLNDGPFFGVLVGTIGMSFAAFCVWLGVRIINRQERWAKRFAIKTVIVFGYAYLLGIGPAFYAASCGWLPDWAGFAIYKFYTPVWFACKIGPIKDLVYWYLDLWQY